MYPTLYHFVYDILGIQVPLLKIIPMFGFWVITAYMTASWLSAIELKRREKAGYIQPQKRTITLGEKATIWDYISNGVIGFILGFKLGYVFSHGEVMNNFPSFILSTTGSILGGGVVTAIMVGWKYWEAKKNELPEVITKDINFHPHQHMSNITMLSIMSGMSGAVVFGTLEKPWLITEFISNPSLGVGHLYNGLAVYGGVIFGIGFGFYYVWKNKLNIIHFMDSLGPTILLAYAIGRIGCHMSGDGDWGIDNLQPKPEWMSMLPDWMWAYDYPNNVNGEGIAVEACKFEPKYCFKLANPVYPTAIYEIIMSTGLFALIWSVRKIVRVPMLLFSFYIIATGAERYVIEQIRVNTIYPDGLFKGFTQAEVISIGLIIIGLTLAVISIFLFKKNKQPDVKPID